MAHDGNFQRLLHTHKLDPLKADAEPMLLKSLKSLTALAENGRVTYLNLYGLGLVRVFLE